MKNHHKKKKKKKERECLVNHIPTLGKVGIDFIRLWLRRKYQLGVFLTFSYYKKVDGASSFVNSI